MEALYHQTNKMVLEVQNGLSHVERATEAEVGAVEADIQARIDQVISNCERLDMLVNKEPPTRRANTKLRVDQLKYDCQHLQSAMRNLQHRRYMKDEAEREREALLDRHFAPNDPNTSIMIDAALQHNQHLQNSNREVDQLLDSGSTMLDSIRSQRVTLKGAHKKILDIANTLGLSNTVLRLIERRSSQDKIILFGGMILTCIIMFLVWKYLT